MIQIQLARLVLLALIIVILVHLMDVYSALLSRILIYTKLNALRQQNAQQVHMLIIRILLIRYAQNALTLVLIALNFYVMSVIMNTIWN